MPTQNTTLYCCKRGEAFEPHQAGSCTVGGFTIENVAINNLGTFYNPYDAAYVLSRTCVEFVCVGGNLDVKVTVGCVPSFVFDVNPSFNVEFDIYNNGSLFPGGHREVEMDTVVSCSQGTCPEVCS